MREIENFKNSVLKDYPRLGKNDTFTFHCHKDLSCFNKCCADVNIFLTPYDIVRMKNRLGISSTEFNLRYAVTLTDGRQIYPLVMLKMQDNEPKSCPFVSESGCTIYEDRPWACRMYPLGVASPREDMSGTEEFYFLLDEPDCLGLDEKKVWTIEKWLEDQGASHYDRMGAFFKEITLHDYFQRQNQLDPAKMEMFHMACYDLDRFRRFVFESSFLKRFEIETEQIERIRNDDVELLEFACTWLKFSIFGEPTLKIKDDLPAASN